MTFEGEVFHQGFLSLELRLVEKQPKVEEESGVQLFEENGQLHQELDQGEGEHCVRKHFIALLPSYHEGEKKTDEKNEVQQIAGNETVVQN